MLRGKISYISTQNVYVKFDNTEGIAIGDTLFAISKGKLTPSILVKNISSISCVGISLGGVKLALSNEIIANIKPKNHENIDLLHPVKSNESVNANDQAIKSITATVNDKKLKSRFDGRFSVSSYSNFSNVKSNQRYRYNLSLNADHIKNSKFSAESYISLTHLSNELSYIGSNISKYLKVYSLAVKYDIDSTSTVSLGRRINVNMANIGAVDGLQYEKRIKNFTYGGVVGFRPDYYDYSFNPHLLQVGAFVSHNVQKENGYMQTSFALFNQTNNLKTDRRFGYFQHSNSLLKNLDFFGSAEFDFYTMNNLQPTTIFDLTSTYLSLRYRPWRPLSLFLSYDARKNIYYYETFKNQIDSILDKETRQGWRFQFNYRPFKFMSWGGSAGYRYQKSDPKPAINANSYLSFPQVPFLNVSAMLNATLLRSNYTNGMVYGASFSRDIIPGIIYGDVEYRMVNYQFNNSTSTLLQNIGELSLTWRIAKKLSLSSDFEATFEGGNNTQRIFLNLTQRF